jgi:hypothetical protein
MSDDVSPLEPNELDELLSADFDGELGAAARDHGSDVETLRARIAATPDAGTRRDELAAARELLAEAPEMDELLAARLRAKAVSAAAAQRERRDDARRRRRSRVVMSTSGIAAAILLVIAAVAAGRAHHDGTSRASSASNESSASPLTVSPAAAAAPRAGSTGTPGVPAPAPDETALGSYRNAQTLASVAVRVANARDVQKKRLDQNSTRYAAGPGLSQPLAVSETTKPTGAKVATSGNGAATFGDAQSSSTADAPATNGAAQTVRCATPASPTPGDQFVLRADATLAGEPVTVFVFAGHGDHTVVVVSATCTLLNVQNLS